MAVEDPNHLQIIEWVVGFIILIGGIIMGIIAKMVKGKKSRSECDLIHLNLTGSLTDIKDRLEKGTTKIDDMKLTLAEISTTLKLRSKDETDRYMRHSEEWKKE